LPQDQRLENLEQFLAERGQGLMRTAVLLTGSVDAAEDLLQTALERMLRQSSRLHGDPEGYLRRTCPTTAALEMGGPPLPTNHWSAFINATLACGAATVTGHVRIDGVDTTKITGSVTVRLSAGYAKVVREKWARARWTLYVDPRTYLPVRMYGSTETFGGPAGSTRFASVTDVQWLRPTAANIAKTLVTIPPGFRHVKSPADQ
jgi:hypothetical protein